MIILLNDILDEKDNSLVIDVALEDFEYNDLSISNLKLSGRASANDKLVILKANIEYDLTGECDRCLSVVNSKENLELVEQYNIKDIKVNEIQGIDLNETAIEKILLNMPSKVLCKDDCLGLCPDCGINLNKESCNCKDNKINPKFAALEKLLEGKGENLGGE